MRARRRQRLQLEIDQHHETEQRLHEAQMNLNHATRIAALGAWSSELRDLEGGGEQCHDLVERDVPLLDYTPDDVPALYCGTCSRACTRPILRRFPPAAMRVQLGKRSWQREFRLVVGDGRGRLVLESAEKRCIG